MLSGWPDRGLLRCVDWFSDRAHDIAAVSSGAWTALAAWLAVAAGIAALVYAWRQYQRAREEAEKVLQPQVPVNNYHTLAQNNVDFEEAHTTVINGRHRRDLS